MDNITTVKNAYDAIAELADFDYDIAGDEVKTFENFLGRIRGNKVIDLGCGHGRLAKHVYEIMGADVIGYDISSKTINIAITKNEYPKNISFCVSDIQDIKNDILFDAAILAFSLIHLTYDQAVVTLINLFDLLKENAEVYISVLMGEVGGYRTDPLDENITTYVKLYTEDEVKKMLRYCGYELTDLVFGEDNDPAAFAKDSMFIIAHKSCKFWEEK